MTKKKPIIKNLEVLVPVEIIQNKIYLIRGRKVMLDFDLALLYNVETKVLIQAVKRNLRSVGSHIKPTSRANFFSQSFKPSV